ncbi:MAG: rRNA maturation RNase YbeY [Kiritimatiellae bacterium]|nr:rRNA maturation RNase YbeY [Kiritimatiellia bacterium]
MVEHLLDRAEGPAKESRPRELSIILMDDEGITKVNEALLQHEGATDVITVRYHALPGEDERDGIAELYVNVERAVQLARRGWPAGRELALYLAHGCDHLAGEDDATPVQRARMRRRELKWLREAEETGYELAAILGDEH